MKTKFTRLVLALVSALMFTSCGDSRDKVIDDTIDHMEEVAEALKDGDKDKSKELEEKGKELAKRMEELDFNLQDHKDSLSEDQKERLEAAKKKLWEAAFSEAGKELIWDGKLEKRLKEEQRQKTSAKAAISSLVQACNDYYENESQLPLNEGATADQERISDNELMSVLVGLESAREENPTGTSYFKFKTATGSGDSLVDGLWRTKNNARLVDPWGNYYRLVFDYDFDQEIREPQAIGRSGTISGLKVLVYSLGPDGIAGGEGEKDNMYSWVTSERTFQDSEKRTSENSKPQISHEEKDSSVTIFEQIKREPKLSLEAKELKAELENDLVADFQMTADEFMISRINGEESNELKWDLQHEGKIFRITGQVTRVARTTARYKYGDFSKDEAWAKEIDKRIQDAELSDLIALWLDVSKAENQNNGSDYLRLELHFSPEYERTLTTLRPGDTIEILGRYITKKRLTGGSILGPTCKILKITRDGTTMPVHATPLPEVVEVEPKYDDLTSVTAEKSLTATELFNTFYRDETGNDLYLESEWSGKVVKITGEVAVVEQGRKGWISDYADPGTSWGAWIKKGEQPDRYVSVKLRVDTIDKRFKVKIESRTVTLNFDKKHLGDLINLNPGDKITAKGRVLLGHGFVNNLANCRVYGIDLQLGPTCAIVPERERDTREATVKPDKVEGPLDTPSRHNMPGKDARNLDHEGLDVERKGAVAAVAQPKPQPDAQQDWQTWKKYPKEISSDSWEKLVSNPAEYDYDKWDRDKMKQVHFFDEEKIAIYKDEKTGNYIWAHKNIQSNVKLIDKKLGLYIVTTYNYGGEGFVNPDASPVQMRTNSEIGKAAYDKIWEDNWLTHYCLKTAYDRMLEEEEDIDENEFGDRVN